MLFDINLLKEKEKIHQVQTVHEIMMQQSFNLQGIRSYLTFDVGIQNVSLKFFIWRINYIIYLLPYCLYTVFYQIQLCALLSSDF